MRKLAIILLLAAIAPPALAAKKVSVARLEQIVSSAHNKSDEKLAQQLQQLTLTERLSVPRMVRMQVRLPGAASRRALVELADFSLFLHPPADEIPATAEPDLATQQKIMALAVDYATKTLRQLPNFFARRDTIQFEDRPASERATGAYVPYVPLRPIGRLTETIFYRDGKESVESASGKRQERAGRGLTTRGVFGTILGTVLVDASTSKLSWSHWEQGNKGVLAVFQFSVPKKQSHYRVEYCCVASEHDGVFRQFPAYHGEISVDPTTGTIYRLTLMADFKPSDPISRSDIVVEYNPVDIGGKTYICPSKSVSITVAPMPMPTMQRYHGSLLDPDQWAAREHMQTSLNDVVFDQYHVFRSEARILTGGAGENAGITNETNHAADAAREEMSTPSTAETAATEEPPPATVAAGTPAPAAPAPAAVPSQGGVAPGPAVPADSAAAEFSEGEGSGLPDIPTSRVTGTQEKGFTLRVTTRLVNVGVVALDKKGHPVTELKPEDFEVYDNGRRQAIRFFSQATTENGDASQVRADEAKTSEDSVFSNRRADLSEASPGKETREASATILMLNPTSLSWSDLSNARSQTLRFLKRLHAGEHVGLYVQTARGFEILVEETTNHAAVETALRGWLPNAQQMAQAQEMERRNRQQFDEVLHQADLADVNGNVNVPASSTTMSDPELRNWGANPGRDALSILVRVARHLAAVPGHKNLVWVASNNVLADWSGRPGGNGNSYKETEDFALHAQEALNDAQVSVYPLNASQLHTQAIDPGLRNSSVELSPSVTNMPNSGLSSNVELPSQNTGPSTGRSGADLLQTIHPIQPVIQQMAKSTGGRVFRSSGNIETQLKSVVADGQAGYVLGFSPDTEADGQYHAITVKLADRRDVRLRYRTGYLYAKEPGTLKDKFARAAWQPLDITEIAVNARPAPAYTGATIHLEFAINDLALRLQNGRWRDNLDIFVIHREDDGLHARITERSLALALLPETYQRLLPTGVPFDQFVEDTRDSGSIRILVVDGNSGRMGSVTLPASILHSKPES